MNNGLDPIAAKKLAQSFTLEYTECQEHNRVVHDLKQELEYSYQKEEMRGLLGKIAESFLSRVDTFALSCFIFKSSSYSISKYFEYLFIIGCKSFLTASPVVDLSFTINSFFRFG